MAGGLVHVVGSGTPKKTGTRHAMGGIMGLIGSRMAMMKKDGGRTGGRAGRGLGGNSISFKIKWRGAGVSGGTDCGLGLTRV